MGDKEYLYELALILDSAEGSKDGDALFIRIEVMSAKHIASRLKNIAANLPGMVH